MENKREFGLDVLKTLAIIFVIARHIPLYALNSNTLNTSKTLQILFSLLSCGVPLFFAVNGYLLFKREDLNLKKHIYKTIKIFFLTILWSIILLVINYLFDGTPFDRSQMIVLFLDTKAGSLYTGELWFLMSLFAIYTIYPILYYLFRNNIRLFLYIFAIITIFNISENMIEILITFINNPIHVNHLNNAVIFMKRFSIIPTQSWWLMYFMLGGIVYKTKELLIKKKIMIILLGITSWILSFGLYYHSVLNSTSIDEYFNDSSIFEIFIILLFFVLVLTIKCNNNKIINFIGANTFGIYVTHFFFIRIARLIIPSVNFFGRFIILIVSLALSSAFTYLLKKVKYLKVIISI